MEPDKRNIPSVGVNLVDTITLPPQQQVIVQVQAQPMPRDGWKSPIYVEQAAYVSSDTRVQPEDVLLQPNERGLTHMVISNPTTMPRVMVKGVCVGEATPVSVIDLVGPAKDDDSVTCEGAVDPPEVVEVRRIKEDEATPLRQETLLKLIPKSESLTPPQKEQLHQLLKDHNQAFSLDEFDQGETDLFEMHIETADSPPVRQSP